MAQARRTRPEVGAASDGRGNLPGEGAGGRHPFRPDRRCDTVMGERCKLPGPSGSGAEPQDQSFFALKISESYAKKRRPRGLSNIFVYTGTSYNSPDNHYEFDTLANDNF